MFDPIHDILNRGGKRWRPVLGMIITEAIGSQVDNQMLFLLGACELIHNGTLIQDDIED